jgi:hypothetical protein
MSLHAHEEALHQRKHAQYCAHLLLSAPGYMHCCCMHSWSLSSSLVLISQHCAENFTSNTHHGNTNSKYHASVIQDRVSLSQTLLDAAAAAMAAVEVAYYCFHCHYYHYRQDHM